MKLNKCNVCGKYFDLKKENKYLVKKTGIENLLNASVYEAFNCPHCGCQKIANVREDYIVSDKKEKQITKIDFYLDPGAYAPEKAHESDAGLDVRTPHAFTVAPEGAAIIDTGVHVQIPEGYTGFLKSKSGLNVKKGLTSEGVIDAGYQGSIVVKLYNHSDTEYNFYKGDKISQLVILPIPDLELKEVKEFKETTDRGSSGFGSSGR